MQDLLSLFDEHGNLPLGTKEMKIEQFFEVFVNGYPSSTTRKDIAIGFARFLVDVLDIYDNFEIWADGSFTTSKMDPNDIDTVTKIYNEQYSQLTPAQRRMTLGKFEGEDTAEKYKVDSYALIVYDKNHPGYQSYLDELNRRTKDFTYDDRTDKNKGIVVMNIDRTDIEYLSRFLEAGGDVK